jgi:hypothetical protein
LHEVLPPGQPHEQKAEEVNVRVLYFLSPRFPRSRRSFDDALIFFARRRASDAKRLRRHRRHRHDRR